jgi:predicted PurR-regulated permease PerM
MSRKIDLREKDVERKVRRHIFFASFAVITLLAGSILLWKLRSLMLPVLVGALLAFLFRPLKDRFQVRWIPHELRVLMLFAAIGCGLFLTVNNLRTHIPNERQKLELKVRLKYKLNEKFRQITGKPNPSDTGFLGALIAREAGPMMIELNKILALTPEERDLFLKYRDGYKGEPPIEDRFYEYFQANQTTSPYVFTERQPATGERAEGNRDNSPHREAGSGHQMSLKESVTIWMLAPIVFIFLGFDNGQMRRYFISLIPNRYFELSLTVMDMLDDAIGKYLRGTLIECGLVGLTLTIGFLLVGIPFSVAVAIGLISGLVNAIPFLGTVIGLVIGLSYALIAENPVPLIPGLNPDDLSVYVVILVGLAHVLDNVVYQPFVLGHAVSLHPIVVVIAIISGSLLGGLWGMLFAIPAVVVLKTAVETLFKELKDYRII